LAQVEVTQTSTKSSQYYEIPDFLIALFYAVDQERLDIPQHPEATLSPSAVVTLTLLPAIKGGGTRAFPLTDAR
jgi:hypothetical protein